jgi:peptidyl-prolyl cis-trans isomerase A (cyclophilin A)
MQLNHIAKALGRFVVPGLMAAAALTSPLAQAGTVVTFTTSLGAFDVELEDQVAPVTVANFLNYVISGAYTNTVFHRSVNNFVVQGGGFYTDFSAVATNAPIVNEASLSNVRGTIAMARTNTLDSATSQWFINTVDNTTLNNPTSPYAVFGHVLGDGMKVVDAIAALPIYNLSNFAGPVFGTVPLQNVPAGASSFQSEFFVTTSISVVPEPQTWLLMGLGLAGVAAVARASRRG